MPSRWKRLWMLVVLVALTGLSLLSLDSVLVPSQKVARCTCTCCTCCMWLASRSWVKCAQTLLELLSAVLLVLLGCFGCLGCLSSQTVAKKPRFWVMVATVPVVIPAVASAAAFVGPPRDRQPLLWEPPEAAQRPRQGSNLKEPKERDERDERLSKRVRAVAIGSAGGILLSLVVQSITPEEPEYYYREPPRREYRRALSAPPPPQPLASSFSFSSLTTGLLVGLGIGVIIGSSMTEETTQESFAQPFSSDNGDAAGSRAPHALQNGDALLARVEVTNDVTQLLQAVHVISLIADPAVKVKTCSTDFFGSVTCDQIPSAEVVRPALKALTAAVPFVQTSDTLGKLGLAVEGMVRVAFEPVRQSVDVTAVFGDSLDPDQGNFTEDSFEQVYSEKVFANVTRIQVLPEFLTSMASVLTMGQQQMLLHKASNAVHGLEGFAAQEAWSAIVSLLSAVQGTPSSDGPILTQQVRALIDGLGALALPLLPVGKELSLRSPLNQTVRADMILAKVDADSHELSKWTY
eukprot:s1216_g7.t1